MNRSVNDDVRSARAQAVTAAWNRAERCEGCGEVKGRGHLYTCPTLPRRPAPEAYTDPDCRFAERDPGHRCHRRDGQVLRYREACHAEARAQLAEQAAASSARAAASAHDGPRYAYAKVPARAREGHADCPSAAMTYGERGGRCDKAAGGCGLVWPLNRTRDGEVVGYTSMPESSASRADEFKGWFD